VHELDDVGTIPDEEEPSSLYPTSGKLERLELTCLTFNAVASLPDFALDALAPSTTWRNERIVVKFWPMLEIPEDEEDDGTDEDDVFWDFNWSVSVTDSSCQSGA
jgi:hypothetical protein